MVFIGCYLVTNGERTHRWFFLRLLAVVWFAREVLSKEIEIEAKRSGTYFRAAWHKEVSHSRRPRCSRQWFAEKVLDVAAEEVTGGW